MEVIAERKNKTVYKDGNHLIKLFNYGYSKPDILNEALNLARVEAAPIKIPKLLEVTTIDNKWGIITEYIEGENMEEIMYRHPEEFDLYLEKFVDIQISIVNNDAVPMLNKIKEKMKRKISNADISQDIKYELNTRLESMNVQNKLCHGDFNPSNVIITPNGECYVIDWAHVTSGAPEADFARTYLIFSLNNKQIEAQKYIDLVTKKTGIEKSTIFKWLPILAASQLSKGNTEERDFLIEWINIAEY